MNVLKPPGISSSGVVVSIRKMLGIKKAGHTGTLDPGASGVLAICTGKATKLSDYLMQGKKEYIAEITFGKRTDTQDSYGRIVEEEQTHVSFDSFLSILPKFLGKTVQVTPAYSAAKQNGEALYKLALKGREITEKKRTVTIYELQAIEQTSAQSFLFRALCEKGTYIRTLCEDIGKTLGVPAYMSVLIRTKTSGLDISQSFTLDELEELSKDGRISEALIPVDEILSGYDKLQAPEECRVKLINGNTVFIENMLHVKNGLYRVYCGLKFLGLGEFNDGSLRIDTHLLGD